MDIHNSIPSGILQLDQLINGFENGKLYIISGRPSTGKSIFLVNVAAYAAFNRDKSIAVFYLEGNINRFVDRLISSECFVEYQKIKNLKFDDSDIDSISQKIENILKYKIYLNNENELTQKKLIQRIQSLKNSDLVLIDYLQLIENEGDSNNNLLLSLRQIAKEKNIPIVLISSLTSKCENRTDHRPLLSDLQSDGILEQLADVVLFLYRDEIYNVFSDKENITEIIVARNRGGNTGVIEVRFIPEFCKLGNLKTIE